MGSGQDDTQREPISTTSATRLHPKIHERGLRRRKKNMPAKLSSPRIIMWRHDDQTYEHASMQPHLRIKLACGLIDAAEYESATSLAHAQGLFQLV